LAAKHTGMLFSQKRSAAMPYRPTLSPGKKSIKVAQLCSSIYRFNPSRLSDHDLRRSRRSLARRSVKRKPWRH